MGKVIRFLVYLILLALAYYLVPFLPRLVPALGQSKTAEFFIFIATPVLCFAISLIRGLFNGMDIIYIIFACGVYVPMIMIYKSTPVFIYGILYVLFCVFGVYVGSFAKSIRTPAVSKAEAEAAEAEEPVLTQTNEKNVQESDLNEKEAESEKDVTDIQNVSQKTDGIQKEEQKSDGISETKEEK